MGTAVAALMLSLASGPVSAAPALVLALGGEPETGFDPMLGWGATGHPLFQSTLLQRRADLTLQGDLAQAWTLSEDGLVWTFELRDGVRFSNGAPLTARDVAFSYQTAKAAAGAVDLQVMDHALALDDTRVEIRLKRPWITFSDVLQSLGIVPAGEYGPGYGRNPIGSGPWQLRSWAEGEQLIVTPNPLYYGERPQFEQLTFLFAGPDAGLAAARAGVADLVLVPAQMAEAVPEGYRSQAARSVDNRALSLPYLPVQPGSDPAVGNAVTSDPALRRAINLGIDRDLLVEVALHGQGTPAFGPADGLPWGGAAPEVSFDPEAAQRLLTAAGWLPGADGIRSRAGQRAEFPIHYPASDPTRQALAETLAELLRPLGIAATPRGGSWQAINRVMHSEPVLFGFGSLSPAAVYQLYAGEQAGRGYGNPVHYRNSQVDALLEQAQNALTPEASWPHWQAAAALYGPLADAPWAWLVNIDHLYLARDCLDLGSLPIEPHLHGWPVTATLADWRWSCS